MEPSSFVSLTHGSFVALRACVCVCVSFHSRLALILAGLEFEDVRIKFPEWKDLKPTTPFGQLPLLQLDDSPEIHTQSMAMMRWIGSQPGGAKLYPEAKRFQIEQAWGVVDDLRHSWTPCLTLSRMPVAYGHAEDYFTTEAGKATIQKVRQHWMTERAPPLLANVEKVLTANGGGSDGFLASTAAEGPTLVDCVAVVFLRGFTRGHIDHIPTTWLAESFPALAAYVQRFCALDGVKGRYTDGLHE